MFPVVKASKIPIATVVTAGIPVKSMLPSFDVAPLEAAVNVATLRAYEPPVTSVPPAASDGATVHTWPLEPSTIR